MSPNPDVDVYTLHAEDYGIVLASDGLTNVMNGADVGCIYHGLVHDDMWKSIVS